MLQHALVLASAILTASAVTYDVYVGGLDDAGNPVLKFEPEFVNAVVGDEILFHYRQRNHSVVQTTFNSVCQPLLNEEYEPAFQTPFYPVGNDQTDDFPTESFIVENDSIPLWFYCGQRRHCGQGMIFSINCPLEGPNTLEAFRERALAIGAQEEAAAASASAYSATATPEVYGGQTYPPIYHPTVTRTVTYGTETYTTVYESYENSPEPTPVAPEGITHTVYVGRNDTFTYDPPTIKANVRDTIRFVFETRNHTVTQSSFGNPCRKLEFTSPTGEIGFDSGFIPGQADGSAFYEIKVNETKPIYAYCRQVGHCGQGMVFTANTDETSARSFAAFQELAKTINGTGAGGNGGGSGGSGNGNGSGSGSGNAAFATSSVVGGVAGIVLAGLTAAATLLL